jgi:hypothetical protein
VGHPEAVDIDLYRRGERRSVDQPTGPLTAPVSASELADATEVAHKRTLQQAYNHKHLSGGGTGKRGNLVGRLVEVKLLGYLEQVGDWEVVDTSDDDEARYRKEGDCRVEAAAGGSPVRLDAKGIRVGDWVTYGRSLYRSQCTDTRVDVIVWGTLADDPTTATEVVLDGWLPMDAIQVEAARADAGGLTTARSRVGPDRVAVRLPMRPMSDLPTWLAQRRQAPPPPKPPQIPTHGFFPADFWNKPHLPGRRIRFVLRDGVRVPMWEDELDPDEIDGP